MYLARSVPGENRRIDLEAFQRERRGACPGDILMRMRYVYEFSNTNNDRVLSSPERNEIMNMSD
jgi:hypothetical protein